MADRYWVGGTGTTGDTTKWSNISGGTGGFSVPVYGDNIYIDTNSHLGAPFEIALSATNIYADKLNILTLTFSLSLISKIAAKTIDLTYGVNIQDNKVYFNGNQSFFSIFTPTDISTATFNSVVKLRNFSDVQLQNCILKSNLDLSASISNPVSSFYAYQNFNSNSKNITIRNYNDINFGGASVTSSITVLNNFSNSTIFIDGVRTYVEFINQANDLTKVKYDFTNCELTISSYVNLNSLACQFFHKNGFSLPKITYNIGGLLGSATGPNRLGVYIQDSNIINKSVYIPKLTINLRDNNTTYKGHEHFKFLTDINNIGKIEFNIGELAISCSEQNRVVFDGNNSRIFIQSASLSQVIFTRCNITGFRDLSVSFSASNIGEFTYFGTKNTNIKIPAPRTVYWNAPTGGNFISNSYTSATGGTVTSTWIPFPQDIVKFVDTGLNSSATISFNVGKSLFLGRIDTSERTIPMTFYISLSWASHYINSGFITNSNTLFRGNTSSLFLEMHGTCTLNIVNSLPIKLVFSRNSNIVLTNPLNSSKALEIYSSTVNFNSNDISVTSVLLGTSPSTILNPPVNFVLGGTGTVFQSNTEFPSTNFRVVSTSAATGRDFISTPGSGSARAKLAIKGIYLEGGSASYWARFLGNFTINDLVYNKIGNVNVYLDPTANPLVVNHIKMMGLPNGSITSSLRFSSNSTSLTAILTYAGIDAAASLSFVEFTRIAVEPRKVFQTTNRVFAGTRSSTSPASNGPVYSDKPRITNVNAGADVQSQSSVKLVTNETTLNPQLKSTYKDIPLTSLSLSNTSTYMATFPNYFSNNIKVGTKHELKIIRGT